MSMIRAHSESYHDQLLGNLTYVSRLIYTPSLITTKENVSCDSFS